VNLNLSICLNRGPRILSIAILALFSVAMTGCFESGGTSGAVKNPSKSAQSNPETTSRAAADSKAKPGSEKSTPTDPDVKAASHSEPKTSESENGKSSKVPSIGESPKAPSDSESPKATSDETARRPLLEGWEKPAATIVLSGEQRGYFEPCGCTGGQLGGMTRRGEIFKQLRDRGWAVTAADLGGNSLRQRTQDVFKFKAILDAMKLMGYRTMAIGPEELGLGIDNLLQNHEISGPNPDEAVAFLAANVTFYDDPTLGTPQPWRVIQVGDVKVGVTAVLGPNYNGTELLAKNNKDIKVGNPDDVLPGVIDELKKHKPDIMLLLSHTNVDESRALAKTYTDFNIVVTAGGPEDPDGKPEKIGDTLLLSVGRKGRSVGVVGYYPQKQGKDRFRFQLEEVDGDRFKDTMSVVELMRVYQHRLLEEKLAGNHADNTPLEHPSGATYVGSEKCGECHTKAYAKWKDETLHANAFESLKHAREGAPEYNITRIYDAECLACHVTGWDPQNVYRYSSGFINEEFAEGEAQQTMSKLLKGVGCESCHGPGSKHIELIEEKPEEAKKLVRVTLEQARKDVCFTCHDNDNSPHFDFDKYWPQVEHKGLD
jgi:hypothetical protein